MPTTIIDNIKGSEIPLPWLEKAKETPNTTFKIILEVKEVKPEIAEPQQATQNKWAKVLADFRKKPFSKEASETLKKASQSFREDFAFREPPHFRNTEK
ncbi:MAG: hypothetical protein HQK62_07795 [Desulfamplus sp.]|nr:hypothetical protein [Desulfamplus sp.]